MRPDVGTHPHPVGAAAVGPLASPFPGRGLGSDVGTWRDVPRQSAWVGCTESFPFMLRAFTKVAISQQLAGLAATVP